MFVIGTAGHVDHGKSTLIRALTGIDPDRLKEEKARQMTIDLGFAWFTLPNGDLVGVIDVPGHRDFIENMLAGVGGINAVLFVIAADEGVMPQTREHLAIIDLLGIPTGVIALTKIDLVHDSDWLDLVQLDILDAISGTVLDGVPIVPISARTGAGLAELQTALATQLATLPQITNAGKPRLWVDRVFSVSGFGTVVTGTLLNGSLTIGQDIELQPGDLRGRIRGLQTHNQTLETAFPGSRVAVNISGVEKRDVHRGHLLTLPDAISPSQRISVRFRHLPDSSRPLRHNAEVKLFCGSAERLARVRLLDSDSLAPGGNAWLQLELADPLPVVKGDRFILRYPSPGETIGGGDVIQTGPAPRYRRHRPEIIASLEALTRSTPAELVIQALNANGLPMSVAQLARITGMNSETLNAALDSASDSVIALNGLWISQAALATLFTRVSRVLSGFHKAEPLRIGMRPESLGQQLSLANATLDAVLNLAAQREIVTRTPMGSVTSYGYIVQMTKAQRAGIERLRETFASAPHTPPSYKEASSIAGEAVVEAMIEWGELVHLSPEVLLTPGVLHEFAAVTEQILAAEGQITIKALRDRFNTSRKYAQAVLETFDKLGITRRRGDDHVTGSGDWSRLPRHEQNYPGYTSVSAD